MIRHLSDHDSPVVDEYLIETLGLEVPELEAGREHAHAAGLPRIEVSTPQGKFLQLLTEISAAHRVLEIGTLGGYSTSWFARGVGESGTVISCEYEQLHASIARENLQRAGLSQRVEIKVGPALDTMDHLIGSREPRFDLIFIDADKRNNVNYLQRALKLSHVGTVIVVDNVIRSGHILDEAPQQGTVEDEDLLGTRQALEWLGSSRKVSATALQTVGLKGWDGLALARVLAV